MKFMYAFGNRIRHFRELRMITQKELTALCGVDSAMISRLETGKEWPEYRVFERICQELGVSAAEFWKPFHWTYTPPRPCSAEYGKGRKAA